jgi:hypothetical protein
VLALLLMQCKQEYNPHIEAKTTGLLVVEGFINSGQGATTIRLSRSSSLEDTVLKPEFNAQVNVDGEDGSSFTLFNNGNGLYTNVQLALNNGLKFRLHIRTADGKEYASDYTQLNILLSLIALPGKEKMMDSEFMPMHVIRKMRRSIINGTMRKPGRSIRLSTPH